MVSKIISVLALAGSSMALTSYNVTSALNGTGSGATSGSGGIAKAPYSVNSTSSSTGNGTPYSNGTILTDEKLFCAFYDAPNTSRGYALNGVVFKIDCGANFGGVIIDVDLTLNITGYHKRAVAEPGLPNCISVCTALDATSTTTCVGTSYNRDTELCTYYSEVGGPIANPGNAIDFAIVTDNGNSDAAGALPGSAVPLVTSVVPPTTQTYTIYSCAATVTDCPYRQVATSVIPAYTTVCPGNAATTGLAAPVACTSCPYQAQVVTVYSNSASALKTVVINVPTPTGSGSVTTGLTTTVVVGKATATSSGVVAFTGAAYHVEAGMGMAALVGAAALLI